MWPNQWGKFEWGTTGALTPSYIFTLGIGCTATSAETPAYTVYQTPTLGGTVSFGINEVNPKRTITAGATVGISISPGFDGLAIGRYRR